MMKENKETKNASHTQLIELIQSNCVHRRRDVVFEDGHNVIKCLDCGKHLGALKKTVPETKIATQGKPEDA